MSVINRITKQSYVKWIEEFVCKVLENANVEFNTVEIEEVEINKRIFIKVDGLEYIIRTWNFHPVGADLQGILCCELVDYSLFKSGEEIAEGKIEIQWEN